MIMLMIDRIPHINRPRRCQLTNQRTHASQTTTKFRNCGTRIKLRENELSFPNRHHPHGNLISPQRTRIATRPSPRPQLTTLLNLAARRSAQAKKTGQYRARIVVGSKFLGVGVLFSDRQHLIQQTPSLPTHKAANPSQPSHNKISQLRDSNQTSGK